jgi:gas vesicle protein
MAEIDIKQAAGVFFAGALVGATVALLYAPQSGVRTQKDIKKLARTTVDRIDDLQTDIRDKVSDWVDDMTEVVKDGVDRGKKLSAGGYEHILHGFDNARKCVEDGKSRFEQLIKNT